MKKYIFGLAVLLVSMSVTAQNKILISGNVKDAASADPLPFASVALKKQLIGIVTNESGNFDLYVPEEMMNDTLMIGYFGYKPQFMLLKNLQSPINVKLQHSTVALSEVVVKPQPPEFYIKMAILRIKYNYPNSPFQTEAYYREKILENTNFIKCNEGIFKTYCPNYLDTIKNQDQLLLFRQEANIHEVEFMSKERKEKEEKEEKKAAKKKEKDVKNGKTPATTTKPNEDDNKGVDIATSFGGPEEILKQGDITKHPDDYLDTLHFKDYKYTFAKSSSYNSSELMVIDFKSRGKVDHVRSSGRIYLDATSYAIVKVESTGDFVIPIIIRPILFLYGLGIENPSFESVIEFQQVKTKWYPKNIQYNIHINLSNNHWFKPDEHSNFVIEGIYTVNKLKIDGISPIPAAKRFDAKKDMKPQVHNDENLTWDQINIIKK